MFFTWLGCLGSIVFLVGVTKLKFSAALSMIKNCIVWKVSVYYTYFPGASQLVWILSIFVYSLPSVAGIKSYGKVLERYVANFCREILNILENDDWRVFRDPWFNSFKFHWRKQRPQKISTSSRSQK